MGNTVDRLLRRKEPALTCVTGLDAAGKTTLLFQLKKMEQDARILASNELP